MRPPLPIVAFALLYAPIWCVADTVTIPAGILTANEYRELPREEQVLYSIGLIDGIFLAVVFEADPADIASFRGCIKGMKVKQIVEIFAAHLSANPAVWHRPANSEFYEAMRRVCGQDLPSSSSR